MKTRNIAQNYIRDAVEIARAEQDITQKRAAGMEHFGLLHVRLAVYVSGRGRIFHEYWGAERYQGTFNDPNQLAFFLFMMVLLLYL